MDASVQPGSAHQLATTVPVVGAPAQIWLGARHLAHASHLQKKGKPNSARIMRRAGAYDLALGTLGLGQSIATGLSIAALFCPVSGVALAILGGIDTLTSIACPVLDSARDIHNLKSKHAPEGHHLWRAAGKIAAAGVMAAGAITMCPPLMVAGNLLYVGVQVVSHRDWIKEKAVHAAQWVKQPGRHRHAPALAEEASSGAVGGGSSRILSRPSSARWPSVLSW
jgi:hypothetical protein